VVGDDIDDENLQFDPKEQFWLFERLKEKPTRTVRSIWNIVESKYLLRIAEFIFVGCSAAEIVVRPSDLSARTTFARKDLKAEPIWAVISEIGNNGRENKG
jgi:hypothetical protein